MVYSLLSISLEKGFLKWAKWPLLGPWQIIRGPRAAKGPEGGPWAVKEPQGGREVII